jgi:uncharacterized protein YbjT (DUF2867 family)
MSATTVIGSTGLVGSFVLKTLLASNSENPKTVQTISRRPPKSEGPKLQAVVEADTSLWTAKLASLSPTPTTVISALGTTRAQAGGIANQWKIDHDLNVELARAAKAQGVRNFVFVSCAGIRSFLSSKAPYSQMKIGVEDTIKDLNFDHAIIVRPGAILGEREKEKAHTGGGLIHAVLNGLGMVSQGLKDAVGQDAEVIARATVAAARIAEEGKAPSKYWVLEAADIVRLGRTEWKE